MALSLWPSEQHTLEFCANLLRVSWRRGVLALGFGLASRSTPPAMARWPCILLATVTGGAAQMNYSRPNSLVGEHLRVAFIRFGDELSVSVGDECGCAEFASCVGCAWGGVVYKLFQGVQLHTGFTYEEVLVSDASKQKYSSTHTACANDVGLGLVDLCVSSFWETTERLELTTFTTSFYNDLIQLFVREQSARDSWDWDVLLFFARPFEGTVWVCVLALSFSSACAFLVAEHGNERWTVPEENEAKPEISKLQGILGVIASPPSNAGLMLEARRRSSQRVDGELGDRFYELRKRLPSYKLAVAQRIARLQFKFLLGFMSPGSLVSHLFSNLPASLGGRGILFAWTVLGVVSMSFYVAKLASLLTLGVQPELEYADIRDVINQGKSVCALSSAKLTLQILYPHLKIDAGATSNDKYQGVEADICVGVVDMSVRSSERHDNCHLKLAGETLLQLPVAQPIRHDIAPYFDYWIRYFDVNGDLAIWRERYSGATCSYESATADTTEQVRLGSFMPLFVLVVMAIICASIEYKFRESYDDRDYNDTVRRTKSGGNLDVADESKTHAIIEAEPPAAGAIGLEPEPAEPTHVLIESEGETENEGAGWAACAY